MNSRDISDGIRLTVGPPDGGLRFMPVYNLVRAGLGARRIAGRGRVCDQADPDARGAGPCLPVPPADLLVPGSRLARCPLLPRAAGRPVAGDAGREAGTGDRWRRVRPCGGRRARDRRSTRGRCRRAGQGPRAQAAGGAGIRSPQPGRARAHAREHRRRGGLLPAVRLPGTSPAPVRPPRVPRRHRPALRRLRVPGDTVAGRPPALGANAGSRLHPGRSRQGPRRRPRAMQSREVKD